MLHNSLDIQTGALNHPHKRHIDKVTSIHEHNMKMYVNAINTHTAQTHTHMVRTQEVYVQSVLYIQE